MLTGTPLEVSAVVAKGAEDNSGACEVEWLGSVVGNPAVHCNRRPTVWAQNQYLTEAARQTAARQWVARRSWRLAMRRTSLRWPYMRAIALRPR